VALGLLHGCTLTTAQEPLGYGWRITNVQTGRTAILVPTVHLGDSRTERLPAWLAAAVREAPVVAVELDAWHPENESRLRSCGFTAFSGAMNRVPPAQVAAIKELADGIVWRDPVAWDALTMKQADDVLAAIAILRSGLTAQQAIDTKAMELVRRDRQVVLELESRCAVLKRLNEMVEFSERRLAEHIDDARQRVLGRVTGSAIEAWVTGQSERFSVEIGELYDRSQKMRRELDHGVFARNPAIAQSIKAALDTHDQILVLVGALHFVSKGSLLDEFEGGGYRVSRLKISKSGVIER
jgi:uncharacterized protein YbaP (TraB family)